MPIFKINNILYSFFRFIERKTAIDRALMHKSILFSNMMSAEEKEQATADVGKLQMQRKDLEDLRAAVRGFAASLPPLQEAIHLPNENYAVIRLITNSHIHA